MKKRRSSKLILVTTILLDVLVILFFFALIKKIEMKEEYIGKIDTERKELHKKNADTTALGKELKESEDQRKELLSHFVDSDNIVSYLDFIESLGTTAGAKVELSKVDISNIKGTKLLVSGKATGDFNNTAKFLSLLESSPYEINIVSMTLSKLPQTAIGGGDWIGLFDIELKSFIVK